MVWCVVVWCVVVWKGGGVEGCGCVVWKGMVVWRCEGWSVVVWGVVCGSVVWCGVW